MIEIKSMYYSSEAMINRVIDAADKILEKYDGTPVYQLACELTYAIINYLERENIVI